jgi:hypothetical protein
MTHAEQAAEYLAHALRDLGVASACLQGVDGAEPEVAATQATEKLVGELLHHVRTVLIGR